MKRVLLILSMMLMGCNMADGAVNVVYEPARTAQDEAARSDIQRSGVIKEIARFITNEFKLPDNLTIRIGTQEGPLFDNKYGEIEIPYSIVTTLSRRLKRNQPDLTEQKTYDATMDALMHIVLHEMGHAIIDMLNLPVIRNEEDEVDDLAAILLVEMFEDGGKIVANAAKAFAMRNEYGGSRGWSSRPGARGWKRHSGDIDRYRNIACLVSGSTSDKYEKTAQGGFDQDECRHRYNLRKTYWMETLAPHLKNGSLGD